MELGVLSFLICDKHWKVRDIIELIKAPLDIKLLFYASLSIEAEAVKKVQSSIKEV